MSSNGRAPRDLEEWEAIPRIRVTAASDPTVAFLNRIARSGGSVLIRYRDREGEETVRSIRPRYLFVKQGLRGTYVAAWCELRGEERVFRLERMTILDPAPPSLAHPPRAPTGETLSGFLEMVEMWALIVVLYLALFVLLPWACRVLT